MAERKVSCSCRISRFFQIFQMIFFTACISASMAGTASAGGWLRNSEGRWWAENGCPVYKGGWVWLDGNGDGYEECYYFDQNGYVLINTVTPDGFYVNLDGMWAVNDAVQQKPTDTGSNDFNSSLDGYYKGYAGFTDWNLNGTADADEQYEISYGWMIHQNEDDSISVLSDQYENLTPTLYYQLSDYVYETPCSELGSDQIIFSGNTVTSICTSSIFKNSEQLVREQALGR